MVSDTRTYLFNVTFIYITHFITRKLNVLIIKYKNYSFKAARCFLKMQAKIKFYLFFTLVLEALLDKTVTRI